MSGSEITLPLEMMFSKSAIDSPALPNSVLNRQQSDRFIDLVINYSVLLQRIRVRRVDHPKGEINKLNLGSIVTEGANSTSTATTRIPSESLVPYDMEKYRSAFDIKTDFLEDNIEKANVRDKILEMFTKRIAIDTEMAAIEGDDSLAVGDGQTDENNLLGVNDGFRQLLLDNVPGGQQLDVSGAAPSKAMYYAMRRLIPSRFRVARPQYVFISSSGPVDKWMLDWSNRVTEGGDAVLATGLKPGPFGTPMLEVPLMPEDLTFGSAGTDGSEVWLTPLDNLIYFIQRDITIEFERKPRNDAWEATIHFRVDFAVEDPTMVVIAKNISLSGSDYA